MSRKRDDEFETLLGGVLEDSAADTDRDCPGADTLAAWSERTLSTDERERWSEHFSDCRRCQATLAAFTATEDAFTKPAFSWLETLSRLLAGPWVRPLAAGAATVLVLSVGLRLFPEIRSDTLLLGKPNSELPPRSVARAPAAKAPQEQTQSRTGFRAPGPGIAEKNGSRISETAGAYQTGRAAEHSAKKSSAIGGAAGTRSAAETPVPLSDGFLAEVRPDGHSDTDLLSRRRAMALARTAIPVAPGLTASVESAESVTGQAADFPGQKSVPEMPSPEEVDTEERNFEDTAPPASTGGLATMAQSAGASLPLVTGDTPGTLASERSTDSEAFRNEASELKNRDEGKSQAPKPAWRLHGENELERSLDGGGTWEPSYTAERRLRDMLAPAPGVVWAVGEGGFVLHYSAEGWSVRPAPTSDDLVEILEGGAESATVKSASGEIWKTRNGGRSWGRVGD